MKILTAAELAAIVSKYLERRFGKVDVETPQGVYLVVSVRLCNGTRRWLKVHEDNLDFADLLPKYFEEHDIGSQLKHGDVTITRPLHDQN